MHTPTLHIYLNITAFTEFDATLRLALKFRSGYSACITDSGLDAAEDGVDDCSFSGLKKDLRGARIGDGGIWGRLTHV